MACPKVFISLQLVREDKKKAKIRHNIYAKEALLQEELFTGLGLDEDEVR